MISDTTAGPAEVVDDQPQAADAAEQMAAATRALRASLTTLPDEPAATSPYPS